MGCDCFDKVSLGLSVQVLSDAVAILDDAVPNPGHGLPEPVFYYISRTTPLINVDLLVQDPSLGTLLAWRDDIYSGTGWHVPGGIIRYKEKIEDRIHQVAKVELQAVVCKFNPVPLAVNEIIAHGQRNRGHFISLLYSCQLATGFEVADQKLPSGMPGYLQWHVEPPPDLLSWHEIYRCFL